MNDDYHVLPELVARAEETARAKGFARSCSRRIGALLRTLAASADGRILEIGSGYGVGSAWLASGMRPGCELVTVEREEEQHEAVKSLFAGRRNVTALRGDWRRALDRGPFGLAFVDVGEAKDDGCDEVVAALDVGGVVVLDDFTPGPLFRGEHDERWHRWMRHPRLASCELLTDEGVAAIVAVRAG